MERNDIIVRDNCLLFWDGWPSQWHASTFTVDGRTYNCAEQFMMAEKAKLFGDEETRQQILNTQHPSGQKKLGRQVKDFDKDTWNNVAKEIVFLGSLAKFIQNKDLADELIASNNLVIVETSPYDKIWGIGMSADHPDATNPYKWQGTNWLGEVLMQVRDVLTYNHKI